MRRRDAIEKLKREAPAAKAMGATSLYLFGSTARDTGRNGSDIDLFIDYDQAKRFSLVDLVGIKLLLEERLGVSIDITTRDSLDPLLKNRIEASAEKIF